jgi:hypothetical protein
MTWIHAKTRPGIAGPAVEGGGTTAEGHGRHEILVRVKGRTPFRGGRVEHIRGFARGNND